MGVTKREATMLTIEGVPAAQFIKEAYDLGADLNGAGRYDLNDPVQRQLRHIRGWIQMAEHDALGSRKANAEREPVSETNVAQFDPQRPELGWHEVPPFPLSQQLKVEGWFARHSVRPIARLLAWWDERGLG